MSKIETDKQIKDAARLRLVYLAIAVSEARAKYLLAVVDYYSHEQDVEHWPLCAPMTTQDEFDARVENRARKWLKDFKFEFTLFNERMPHTGKCDWCGDGFNGRANRVFCSENCRQKRYQRRKALETIQSQLEETE